MTTMNDAPLGYMPIPTVEQLAEALANVRCFHDMSAELIAPELLANLLASTTVKAEQVDVCDTCHGQGEVYSGHDQHFHYFDFQPPEPIMEVCPECDGDEAPSLPAAGSAEEEVEVVAWRYRHSEQEKWQAGVERKSLWETEPLMTVAQHERILAAATRPADQVAEGVVVSRELLENCTDYMMGSASARVRIWHDQCRALLASAGQEVES